MVAEETGLEIAELFNPVAGAQEYVAPPEAFSVVEVPEQIVVLDALTLAVG